MSNEVKIPEIVIENSPTFKRIIVSGIYGHISTLGLEATIFTESDILDEAFKSQLVDPNKVKTKRTIEGGLIISPLQMIEIRNWLNLRINEYEKIFGKILDAEEANKRAENLIDETKKALNEKQ